MLRNPVKEGEEKKKVRSPIRLVTDIVLFLTLAYATVRFASRLPRYIRTLRKANPTGAQRGDDVRTLSFQTCNGFANQRISLVLGIVLAKELQRHVLLPGFILNGVQMDASVTVAGPTVPLQRAYDTRLLRQALARHGLKAFLGADPTPPASCAQVGQPCLQRLREKTQDAGHVSFGCVFAEQIVGPQIVANHEALVKDVLRSLQPSDRLSAVVDRMARLLGFVSQAPGFNLLHIRAEEDWIRHCRGWASLRDGIVRDNCMNNTFALGGALASKGFPRDVPLYVTSHWPLVEGPVRDSVLASVAASGYDYVTDTTIYPGVELEREERALVNYYLGLRANMTMGNSVATFSALMILERRLQGRYATHYNGGNIPLLDFLPLGRFPWVFLYNDRTRTDYAYLARAAVRSAARAGGVAPFCLYYGPRDSVMRRWLAAHNVTVIAVEPLWRRWLARMKLLPTGREHALPGALPDALPQLRTFLRLEIPFLKELREYDFVFYSDPNVYFRSRLLEGYFPLPLPRTVGFGGDAPDGDDPYNAQVALWNVHAMREFPYRRFFAAGGPPSDARAAPPVLDQSVLRRFYRNSTSQWAMPAALNAKPYQAFDPQAVVVHWHGPKPHDYLDYLRADKCDYGPLCASALDTGLCPYAAEWARHTDVAVAAQLVEACRALRS